MPSLPHWSDATKDGKEGLMKPLSPCQAIRKKIFKYASLYLTCFGLDKKVGEAEKAKQFNCFKWLQKREKANPSN